MDMSLSRLRELVMDRESWSVSAHGVVKSRTWLSYWTALNWTDKMNWGSQWHFKYGALKYSIKFSISFNFSEKVSWAWQVHILRWIFYPVKKTVWHIKYFVYLILFVLLDFYISLFSWFWSATSVLPTVQFFLNILPLMFPERMCGEWIWQIWTNLSMSSLQLYSFPGDELL